MGAAIPCLSCKATNLSPTRRFTMPAEVESMFSVREMPWHRQGVVLGEYPESWTEVRQLAGLVPV